MTGIRLKFNPIIPLLRGLSALICSAFSILLIWAFLLIIHYKGYENGLIFHILGHLLFAYFSYVLLRALLSQTRNYTINPQNIIQLNYLSDIEKQIQKQDVTSFKTERIPRNPLRFKRITIHLSNGKKIRLNQFEFFNFKKIEPVLIEYGYPSTAPQLPPETA